MSGSAVNKALRVGRGTRTRAAHGRSHLGRRILGVGIIVVIVVTVAALVADTVAAMRTEYGFSRALLTSPGLTYEPEVTISGFPFLTHTRDGRFSGAVITARGVSVACPPRDGCHAELGATLGPMTVPDGFSIGPSDIVHTESLNAYTRLDSVNLGRMLGIVDLTVNTPAPADKAGGGGPGDGLLRRSTGIVLTGTVPLPSSRASADVAPSASTYDGPTVRVSVLVDLSVVDGRLHLEATDFYRGPERHADTEVAEDLRDLVLSAFTATLPVLPLPWDLSPAEAHSEGSDVLLAGDAGPRDLRPDAF